MSPILFDSRNIQCKMPFGAVPAGTKVTFRVNLPITYALRSARLLMYKADLWDTPECIPMVFEKSSGILNTYRCTFTPDAPQLYFYLFEVEGINALLRISRNSDGFGVLSPDGAEKWQLTVYDARMRAPEALRGGIMYQIFPDRFCSAGGIKRNVPADRWMHQDWYELPAYLPDQNGEVTNSDYFGGDLAGITEKLPYLSGLGVSVLYLNPIFEAHSNHRYNTADYEKIDPLLGTEDDFILLCEKAHSLGISIILDGVFNHTGSDSIYFNKKRRYGDGGAFNDENSPYRSWYAFNQYPDDYQSWWGFKELPSLNEHDPSYSSFICGEKGVLKKWLKRGASGYRLDVADELPDDFLDKICASVKAYNPQAAVIGEVWEDASTKCAYGVRRRYLLGKQLDSVMNYPFKDSILRYVRHGDCNTLYTTVMSILEHYPRPVIEVLMNSLSTHDVERAITALAGTPVDSNGREWQAAHNTLTNEQYALGKALFRLAAVIQYLLPGIPCLYYGDEAGLYGYKDPFNRSCYPWGREDQELIAFFRALGDIRRRYPELSSIDFKAVSFVPEAISFVREAEEHAFYVAVNRTELTIPAIIPADFDESTVLLGGMDNGSLPPYGYVVLLK